MRGRIPASTPPCSVCKTLASHILPSVLLHRMRSAILLLVTLTGAFAASGLLARADAQIVSEDLPTIRPDISGAWPDGLQGSGEIRLILDPALTINPARLTLIVGGDVEPTPPTGFPVFSPLPGPAPVLHGLVPAVAASVGLALSVGIPDTTLLEIQPGSVQGFGYVLAEVQSLPGALPLDGPEMALLFFLVKQDTTYFSSHSVLHLRVQSLSDSLSAEGASPTEIESAVRRLRRSGAKTSVSVSLGPGIGGDALALNGPMSPGSYPNSQPPELITVTGKVKFTAKNGSEHPVRFAEVEIWDDGSAETKLVTVLTDPSGSYIAKISHVDDDGTGPDIFVVARAAGATVSVSDAWGGGVQALDMRDATPPVTAVPNVADGGIVEVDITAVNDPPPEFLPQNTAFEVYEAVNHISRFLPALGEALPSQADVIYPHGDTDPNRSWFSAGGSSSIHIGLFDRHDWDNIEHEYGHWLQETFGFRATTSASLGHSTRWNLCEVYSTYGKEAGIRIALKEAWATFIAISFQADQNLNALGIPTLGDTQYQDGTLVYDLEVMEAIRRHGEGSTGSVMATLWDLYDSADDEDDNGVQIASDVLWKLLSTNKPLTFSAYWADLISGATVPERVAWGAILSQHLIAAQHLSPADGFVQSSGASPPTFSWTGNLHCSDSASDELYRVVFYNDDLSTELLASAWSSATTFPPSAAQSNIIFAGPNGSIVRWVVESRDETTPETGPYNSGARSIVDESEDEVDTDVVFGLSLHAGTALPGSGLSTSYDPGTTVNADLTVRLTPTLSVDLRGGHSSLNGGSAADLDIQNLSVNAKADVANLGVFSFFFNAGFGLYWVDGVNDFGANVGLGLAYPFASTTLELTFNNHWISASPETLQFSKLQIGLLWWP